MSKLGMLLNVYKRFFTTDYVYMHICEFIHASAVAHRSWKRAWDPLEMKPQIIVSLQEGHESL